MGRQGAASVSSNFRRLLYENALSQNGFGFPCLCWGGKGVGIFGTQSGVAAPRVQL